MEIGRVRVSDLDAIGKLHAHFWGEVSDVDLMAETLSRLGNDPNHVLLAARIIAETLSRLGNDPNHVLLAARIDDECVGTATGVVCHGLYGGSDSYLVIEDVVVDPSHRRNGVASALLGELERLARDRSCKQMIVLTEACRDDAVGLYESAGFVGRWTGFKKKL